MTSLVSRSARHEPDPDTVRAAAAGGKQALNELLGHLRPDILRYCSRRMPDRSDTGVDDITQDVMVGVIRALPGMPDPTLDGVAALARTMAFRRIADLYRRRSSRGRYEQTVEHDVVVDAMTCWVTPDRVVEGRAELYALAEAVRRFTPAMRAAVEARALEMTWEEASAVAGRSPATLRGLFSRAMRALRQDAA